MISKFDMERLLIELYQFCDRLDFCYQDENVEYDSFERFLSDFEKHCNYRMKQSISYDLRLILDSYKRLLDNEGES